MAQTKSAPKPGVTERVSKVLDDWFADRVQNSPASRDTRVYNHLHGAFGDLKKDVMAELGVDHSATNQSEVTEDVS